MRNINVDLIYNINMNSFYQFSHCNDQACFNTAKDDTDVCTDADDKVEFVDFPKVDDLFIVD